MDPVGLGLLVATASVILCATAVSAWVRIDAPTANVFGVLTAATGLGGLGIAAAFLAQRWLLVLALTIGVGMTLPLVWLVFALHYVGREDVATPANIALVAIPIVLGLSATGIVFSSHLVSGFELPARGVATGGVAVLMTAVNLLQWFGLLYAGGLVLAGSGVVLWAFQRYNHLDSTTGLALGTFGTIPWLSLFFGLQLESMSMIAYGSVVGIGFLVGAIAAISLTGPTPLFAQVPSAGSIGPRTVIEELADLVIVTDREGVIVEANASTRQAFDLDDVLGKPVADVLPCTFANLEDARAVELESPNGRSLYAPTVSPLTDQHGQVLGYGIVLRDMTAQQTRQQLLEVFTRVLRHNLRNDMNVILGHAEWIQRQVTDQSLIESTSTILTNGASLTDLSATAREAERVLEIDISTAPPTEIRSLIEEIRRDVRNSHDVECEYRGPGTGTISIPEEMLRLVLRHLVTNAIEHAHVTDPDVRIHLETGRAPPYPVRLSVSDNGPGIPEAERRVIAEGSETPLEHGSGVGLWIVRIIVTRLGGQLSFETRDPHGTTVRVDLPTSMSDEMSEDGNDRVSVAIPE